MNVYDSLKRFSDDKRAVSAVIGFILIFGILMLTLTVYQAQIVPQQNAQTEFKHFEDTRDELIEIRNSISRTGQASDPQFPSVTLGTNYQSRVLTINPAPAAGTFQTSEKYNISISEKNTESDPVNISTRFIEYEPGYNEITTGSTWYENSVLYTDIDGDDDITIIEDQNLVTDGNLLKITVLQNEFQQSSTSRISVELYPTTSNNNPLEGLDGPLTVKIPTRLAGDEYWETKLEMKDAVSYEGDEIYDAEDEIYQLNLTVDDKDDLTLNTVGIQSEPNEEPARHNILDRDENEGGEDLPEDAVAFSESTYTAEEIADFDDENVDLVIERDIDTNEIEDEDSIEIEANTVTVRDDVTLTSENEIEIDAYEGDTDLSGAVLEAEDEDDIDLTADEGDIILTDTILQTDGDMTASPADDGTLFVNNADEGGSGTIIEDNDGEESELDLEQGTLDGTPERGDINEP